MQDLMAALREPVSKARASRSEDTGPAGMYELPKPNETAGREEEGGRERGGGCEEEGVAKEKAAVKKEVVAKEERVGCWSCGVWCGVSCVVPGWRWGRAGVCRRVALAACVGLLGAGARS
ncbi:hypothetical protein AB0E10_44460 [Streptomyces sp. NPDC048045]|uniref:hypothetical protein n=1 Tax=Streptomyces sp. NPDC048045 TaxID=3154710 RepID=UPI003420B9B4